MMMTRDLQNVRCSLWVQDLRIKFPTRIVQNAQMSRYHNLQQIYEDFNILAHFPMKIKKQQFYNEFIIYVI